MGRPREVPPELVDQLNPKRDMPHHLTMQVELLSKACFRIVVFPELAAIVEKDSGEKQVLVEVRVSVADRRSRTHHLRHVLDEATPTCVVVAPGRGGATEAFAEVFEKLVSESVQAGVRQGGTGIDDVIPVLLLFACCGWIAAEEVLGFRVVETAHLPVRAVDSVLILTPAAFRPDTGSAGKFTELSELRMVAPHFEAEVAGGIRKGKLKVGGSTFCFLFRAVLELSIEKRLAGRFIGSLLELRDGDEFHRFS